MYLSNLRFIQTKCHLFWSLFSRSSKSRHQLFLIVYQSCLQIILFKSRLYELLTCSMVSGNSQFDYPQTIFWAIVKAHNSRSSEDTTTKNMISLYPIRISFIWFCVSAPQNIRESGWCLRSFLTPIFPCSRQKEKNWNCHC